MKSAFQAFPNICDIRILCNRHMLFCSSMPSQNRANCANAFIFYQFHMGSLAVCSLSVHFYMGSLALCSFSRHYLTLRVVAVEPHNPPTPHPPTRSRLHESSSFTFQHDLKKHQNKFPKPSIVTPFESQSHLKMKGVFVRLGQKSRPQNASRSPDPRIPHFVDC